jgi:hypothetical protein
MKDKTYDLIIPLGHRCHCSDMLRRCVPVPLVKEDGPWDWSGTPYAAGIYKRLDLLIYGFDNFFEREDLMCSLPAEWAQVSTDNTPALYWAKRELLTKTFENMKVFNRRTLTEYVHDFKKDQDFEEGFIAVREKYLRRTNRTRRQIDGADRILLVYESHLFDDRTFVPLDSSEVRIRMRRLRSRYPTKTIDMIMFDHDHNLHANRVLEKRLMRGVIRYVTNHDMTFPADDDNPHHRLYDVMMPLQVFKILQNYHLKEPEQNAGIVGAGKS